MPFGKSTEEKEAERAEKERRRAEAARQEADRRAAAQRAEAQARFRAGPVGQASTAMEANQRFFEIQLMVGRTESSTGWLAGERSETSAINHAETLAAIEDLGWRLEHVGYVFMVTNESGRERGFGGESIAVSGQTVGIYLFRNVES
jgi:hypothetical protein